MEENTQMITRPLETIEGEILFYKQQTAIGIMEIGKRLIEAKEQLKKDSPGTWEKWLKEKVDFSNTSAKRFMRVAKEFENRPALVDLGQTKLFALLELPSDDRDEFVTTSHEVNGEVKTVDEMTSRELSQAIKEKNEALKGKEEAEKQANALKQALETEKSKPKEKEIVNNTVTVDNTDYSLKTEAERLEKEKAEILKELENAKAEKDILNKQVVIEKERNDFLENIQKEYGDLKLGIELLTEQKDSISRQVSTGTELSGLIVNIQSFIKEELSPIAYSRALREASDCDIVRDNLNEIVDVVENWCRDMRGYLVNNNNTNEEIVIIEGEVITNE